MSVCENRLVDVQLNTFKYADGTESRVHSFAKFIRGEKYPIHVFHGSLRPYGKRGLCIKIPIVLSSRFDEDRRNHLWFIELFHAGEEHTGVKYVFHKFIRSEGGNECIPIPASLVDCIEDVPWTVVISPLDKYMLKQYDGFVYPSHVLFKIGFDFDQLVGL